MKTSFGWINVKKVPGPKPRKWKWNCSCLQWHGGFKAQKTAERSAAKHIKEHHGSGIINPLEVKVNT